MNTQTGEVITDEQMRMKQEAWDRECGIKGIPKTKVPWWIPCQVEPKKVQLQSGLKGWHLCLCGSGKKFRDCCKVKTPYVRRKK